METLRVALWPRRSFARSAKYVFYRLWRLSGSPHAIAIGCAIGVFIGFTPLYGFQFLLAVTLAWGLGGSMIAAVLGTFVANPLSFPLIWYSTYKAGCIMLTGNVFGACGSLPEGFTNWASSILARLMDFSVETAIMLFQGVWPVFKPMALGSLPLGALAAVATYFAVRQMVNLRQRQRREQLADMAAKVIAPLALPHGSSEQGA